MSQAKVEKYKELKKNRKEILEKEKKRKKQSKFVSRLVGFLIVAGLATAIGITIQNEYASWKAAQPVYTRDEFILGQMVETSTSSEENGKTETDAEETEEADTTAAEE